MKGVIEVKGLKAPSFKGKGNQRRIPVDTASVPLTTIRGGVGGGSKAASLQPNNMTTSNTKCNYNNNSSSSSRTNTLASGGKTSTLLSSSSTSRGRGGGGRGGMSVGAATAQSIPSSTIPNTKTTITSSRTPVSRGEGGRRGSVREDTYTSSSVSRRLRSKSLDAIHISRGREGVGQVGGQEGGRERGMGIVVGGYMRRSMSGLRTSFASNNSSDSAYR